MQTCTNRCTRTWCEPPHRRLCASSGSPVFILAGGRKVGELLVKSSHNTLNLATFLKYEKASGLKPSLRLEQQAFEQGGSE